eukprot:1300335-Rhodomonas_salina.1
MPMTIRKLGIPRGRSLGTTARAGSPKASPLNLKLQIEEARSVLLIPRHTFLSKLPQNRICTLQFDELDLTAFHPYFDHSVVPALQIRNRATHIQQLPQHNPKRPHVTELRVLWWIIERLRGSPPHWGHWFEDCIWRLCRTRIEVPELGLDGCSGSGEQQVRDHHRAQHQEAVRHSVLCQVRHGRADLSCAVPLHAQRH